MACYPSKIQHILYSEERYKDLIALKAPLEVNDDLNLNEKLRVFKGDKLAAQFEVGKQKSRSCYCFTCGIHAGAAARYIHSNKLRLQTISQRVCIINMSHKARSLSKTGNLKLFDNLKKHQIVVEHKSHNIKFLVQDSQKDRQD